MAKKQNPAVEEEMNEKDFAQQKQELIEFYNDAVPQLEAQLQYEDLAADVEEARLRRLMAQMRIAQLMAPPQEEEGEPAPRTLKRK
jgi:hypothetical protein